MRPFLFAKPDPFSRSFFSFDTTLPFLLAKPNLFDTTQSFLFAKPDLFETTLPFPLQHIAPLYNELSNNWTMDEPTVCPKLKRKRLGIACNNCRSKCIRCDARRPCHECERDGVECITTKIDKYRNGASIAKQRRAVDLTREPSEALPTDAIDPSFWTLPSSFEDLVPQTPEVPCRDAFVTQRVYSICKTRIIYTTNQMSL
ncbi:hypothetical protein N7520_000972 [Penicillium odoratum]|uniref:uncharacterized protein n=1 Tax=Penicillium odoratum TaxID=1167516 RepID=UPI002548857F|nr:uncharacterized protein N7520_000972 [Penicillium odoratum]KAJ5777726.1 hypothetical protein N7520_000972 [Penicillium odoratum]